MSEQDIVSQIKRNMNQVFIIKKTLNALQNNNIDGTKPKCPQCKSEFLRLLADNRSCVIRCMKCFNEEYYVRIVKNEK